MILKDRLSGLWPAAFFGLTFFMGLLLAEGFYIALSESVPLWMGVFNMGAGVLLALMSMSLFALLQAAWSLLLRLDKTSTSDGPMTRIINWFCHQGSEISIWRSARLITVVLVTPIWLGIGALAADSFSTMVNTAAYVGLIVAIFLLVTAVFFYAISPLFIIPLGVLLRMLSRRNKVGVFVRPLVIVIVMLVGGLGLFVFGWSLFGEVLQLMPWALAIGPIAGVALALALTVWIAWSRFLFKRALIIAGVFCITTGVFTAFLPVELNAARSVFINNRSVASWWMGILEKRLDFDKDGATGFYAGGDCAPYNPAIGPHRMEILNNGIDEDCRHGDLKIDPNYFKAGPKQHPRPNDLAKRPNIILLTTDALSERHLSSSGYFRDVTPNLSNWMKSATQFKSAFTTGTATRLAFPGLLTGMYHSMLPLKGKRQPYKYRSSVKTIAAMLKTKGYRTVHIAGDRFFKKWGGFANGFDVVEQPWKNSVDRKHPAPELSRAAVKHINADKDAPLFLWVHFFDHHSPYSVPVGSKSFGNKPVDRYDSELLFTDAQWKPIFDAVAQKWKPSEYLLFFTSDHGEAFDKNHPTNKHSGTHYTQVLHVPFIVQSPWLRGEKVEGLVSHFDIIVTIANMLGIAPKDNWMGESLVASLVDGVKTEKRAVSALTYHPGKARKKESGFLRMSIRTDEFHYFTHIPKDRRRLVRWRNNPLDKHNLYKKLPDQAAIFDYKIAKLLKFLQSHEKGLVSK